MSFTTSSAADAPASRPGLSGEKIGGAHGILGHAGICDVI
jgi:hypothetical protein